MCGLVSLRICCATLTCPYLQVTTLSHAVASTKVETRQAMGNNKEASLSAVTTLVIACTAALSSPEVAKEFSDAVRHLCRNVCAPANRDTCGSAGAIHAIVAALDTHGVGDATVAANGFDALIELANDNPANADDVVLTAGGLDVILSVMAAHEWHVEVQWRACMLLMTIALSASPAVLAVMREGSAQVLLSNAMANHPSSEAVETAARGALVMLVQHDPEVEVAIPHPEPDVPDAADAVETVSTPGPVR